jgi:uncharacterized coiled-coil protein SlyX
MEQAELNFYINTLQKKMNDYFTQSIVLESKIAYQNDIISQQNDKIKELNKAIEEYQGQIKNFDETMKKSTSRATRKKTESPSDGGTF